MTTSTYFTRQEKLFVSDLACIRNEGVRISGDAQLAIDAMYHSGRTEAVWFRSDVLSEERPDDDCWAFSVTYIGDTLYIGMPIEFEVRP